MRLAIVLFAFVAASPAALAALPPLTDAGADLSGRTNCGGAWEESAACTMPCAPPGALFVLANARGEGPVSLHVRLSCGVDAPTGFVELFAVECEDAGAGRAGCFEVEGPDGPLPAGVLEGRCTVTGVGAGDFYCASETLTSTDAHVGDVDGDGYPEAGAGVGTPGLVCVDAENPLRGVRVAAAPAGQEVRAGAGVPCGPFAYAYVDGGAPSAQG